MKQLKEKGIVLVFCGHLPTGPSQGLLMGDISGVFTDTGRALNTGYRPEGNNTDTTGGAWSLASFHTDQRNNAFFLVQGVLPYQFERHPLDGKSYAFCVPLNTKNLLDLSAFPESFQQYRVAPEVGRESRIDDQVERIIGLFDLNDGAGPHYYTRRFQHGQFNSQFRLSAAPLVKTCQWYPSINDFNANINATAEVMFLLDLDGTLSMVDESADPPVAPWLNMTLIAWLHDIHQRLRAQNIAVTFNFFTARDISGCLEHAYYDFLPTQNPNDIHTINNLMTLLQKEEINISQVFHAFDGLEEYEPGQFYAEEIVELEKTFLHPEHSRYLPTLSATIFKNEHRTLKEKDADLMKRADDAKMLNGKYPLKSKVLEKIGNSSHSKKILIVIDDNERIIHELNEKFKCIDKGASVIIIHCPNDRAPESSIEGFYTKLSTYVNETRMHASPVIAEIETLINIRLIGEIVEGMSSSNLWTQERTDRTASAASSSNSSFSCANTGKTG